MPAFDVNILLTRWTNLDSIGIMNLQKIVVQEEEKMGTVLKIILKILLSPVVLLLSVVLLAAKGALYVVGGISGVLAIIFGIYGIYCLFDEVYRWSATPALISAFLLSPLGIPLVAVIIIGNLELFRDWLREI